MDDSLYPDSEPDEKASEDAPKKPEAKDDKEEKDEHTELVGKKLLKLDEDAEIKPGTTCTFKVVKDWGDSVEIRYVKKDKKDEEDSDDDTEEKSADDELDEIESGSMKGKSYAGM